MKKISILIFLLGTQLAFSQATQQDNNKTPPSSNSKPNEKY
jgi:hypothetical protein